MHRCRERSIGGMSCQGDDWPTWGSEFCLAGNLDSLSRDTSLESPWLSESFAYGVSNSCGPLPITATIIWQSKIEMRRKQLISSAFA